MYIIVPKHYIPSSKLTKCTVFFLAGPARGGGDWQKDMCEHIHRLLPEAVIVCPRRWNHTHPHAKYFLAGDEKHFERQLAWEQHYLKRAGVGATFKSHREKGCIIFWLPCESTKDPHPGPEPYAMDTRGELGEWRMRMKYESARVVVGGHPRFFGLSQIQRNFSAVLGFDFPIYLTMEETVRAALATAQSGMFDSEKAYATD